MSQYSAPTSPAAGPLMTPSPQIVHCAGSCGGRHLFAIVSRQVGHCVGGPGGRIALGPTGLGTSDVGPVSQVSPGVSSAVKAPSPQRQGETRFVDPVAPPGLGVAQAVPPPTHVLTADADEAAATKRSAGAARQASTFGFPTMLTNFAAHDPCTRSQKPFGVSALHWLSIVHAMPAGSTSPLGPTVA